MILIGIDIGTQGIRSIAVDETGKLIAISQMDFPPSLESREGFIEQDPKNWEKALWQCLLKLIQEIKREHPLSLVRAICIDGTSGTVIPIDQNNIPLTKALMYNDPRAQEEAKIVRRVAGDFSEKVGYTFNSSYALPKILWIKNHLPHIYRQTKTFIHQTDYIVGKLTGIYNITDHSNALKTGFDLINQKWPQDILEQLGLDIGKLPKVVRPGDIIGNIKPEVAKEFDFDKDLVVVAGITDGCAGQIASGAVTVGAWNSILGTTLVIKGITQNLIKDEKGRIYSHLHPEGYWMPGGASNTGGQCLEKVFPNLDYPEQDKKAIKRTPTDLIIYPLVKEGERFPFVNPGAKGFIKGSYKDNVTLYAGYLEGVGFLEKLCYETLIGLGANDPQKIFVTGGGAKSLEWLRIRASILNKVLIRPEVSESCMGSAILAASKTVYSSISEAASHMVRPHQIVYPDSNQTKAYNQKYLQFKDIMKQKGYI